MDANAWFDLFVAIVLLITTIRGAIRGVFWELATVGAIVLCFAFAQQLSAKISPHVPVGEPLNRWLSLLVLYVGFSFVSFSVARVLSGWAERLRFRAYDRHLGALVGLLKGIVVSVIAICFLVTIIPATRDAVLRSRSGRVAAVILDAVHPALPPEIHEIVHPYLHQLDVGDGAPDHAPGSSSPQQQPHAHEGTAGHDVSQNTDQPHRATATSRPDPRNADEAARHEQPKVVGDGTPPRRSTTSPREPSGPADSDERTSRPAPSPPTPEEIFWRIFQIGVSARPQTDTPASPPDTAPKEDPGVAATSGAPANPVASPAASPPITELITQVLIEGLLNRIDDPEVRASWREAWREATPQQRRELVDRLTEQPPEKAAAEFQDWV
ncbi:MAG: hypothetical protein D6725_07205, partial [Planctomycetota bacterium]